MPLVRGVGIYYPTEKYYCCLNRITTKEYYLWQRMLTRCYSEKFLIKNPSYKGCTVDESFKNFQIFMEWCEQQIGFNVEGFQLDKDLLIKGNKIYSPNTCVFLPKELNMLLVTSKGSRGDLPIGVSCDNERGGYKAQCGTRTRHRFLGRFGTVEEAFIVYKSYKEGLIKSLAEKWKNEIDPRAYSALINYKVDTTD